MKVLTALSSLFIAGSSLAEGADLPEISGINQNGEIVKIAPKKGDQWLLIFTYPKASSPG